FDCPLPDRRRKLLMTHTHPRPVARPARRHLALALLLLLPALPGCFASAGSSEEKQPVADPEPVARAPLARTLRDNDRIRAPELDGGIDWLNAAGPIRMKDLRGKVVILDFWTYCCINCLHTLPDLARLERKYANQLVVIGVHSAKFDNEKETENIRKAVLRYEIAHPVVNDAHMRIWRRYRADSWPTLALIDPEGRYVGSTTGEGNYELLDRILTQQIPLFRKKKLLNEKPIKFELARFQETGKSPLFFPGKVLADGASGRLFIADSTHHRIVITDLAGKKVTVAGTGRPGRDDGPFAKVSFDDPQGLALKGDTLYVADRKNHLIRALDLKKQTVTTVAGTGEQSQERGGVGDALRTGLNSPWDLFLRGNDLF